MANTQQKIKVTMRRRKGRPIDGILVLNKPTGDSSNRALQRTKHLFEAQKAGHTGNLDPMATGVLPICLGEATKFSQYLLDADKAYEATVRLGVQTTTGDAEGEVLESIDASHITLSDIERVIPQFLGVIAQVPPMYSALKVDGQPLYKLARQGIEIERKARTIEIFSLAINDFRSGVHPELDITVYCSKGTYIRTLAEDIATALGNIGGHLIRLHRIQAGEFLIQQSITLEALLALKDQQGVEGLDTLLISPEQAVIHLPVVEVSAKAGYYVRLGQTVSVPDVPHRGLVRIRMEDEGFIGVGEMSDEGRLSPRRLMATHEVA